MEKVNAWCEKKRIDDATKFAHVKTISVAVIITQWSVERQTWRIDLPFLNFVTLFAKVDNLVSYVMRASDKTWFPISKDDRKKTVEELGLRDGDEIYFSKHMPGSPPPPLMLAI